MDAKDFLKKESLSHLTQLIVENNKVSVTYFFFVKDNNAQDVQDLWSCDVLRRSLYPSEIKRIRSYTHSLRIILKERLCIMQSDGLNLGKNLS